MTRNGKGTDGGRHGTIWKQWGKARNKWETKAKAEQNGTGKKSDSNQNGKDEGRNGQIGKQRLIRNAMEATMEGTWNRDAAGSSRPKKQCTWSVARSGSNSWHLTAKHWIALESKLNNHVDKAGEQTQMNRNCKAGEQTQIRNWDKVADQVVKHAAGRQNQISFVK